MGIGNLFGGSEVKIIITAVDKFSTTMKSARAQLQGMTVAMSALGVAAAAGLGIALKTAIDFETAFTGVRKTVELSEKEFGVLEQRFKDLSTEIPVTFVELSRIGELAGQLGVSGVEDLTKFTDTIARIAVTTNLTAEDAATSFARIANIMQEPIENIDRMGSVVVELGNNFATTESEIVTFATRMAAAGKTVGISTQEIFGIATAFTSVGIQAELGGSAIIRVLNEMNKSVLTSDENLALFAKTAGLSIQEFEELFRKDAAGAFAAFVQGLTDEGVVAAQVLDGLELGSVRIVQAFTSVSQAGDLITRSIGTANDEFEKNNALTKESANRFGTLASQIQVAKNRLLLVAEALGENLAEQLIPFVEDGGLLDRLTQKFLDLSEPQQDFINNLLGVTAGLGAVAIGMRIFGVASASAFASVALIIGFLALGITIFQNWEFAQAKVAQATVSAWNIIVDAIQGSINIILKSIFALISLLNAIPGVDITIPQIDLSGARAQQVSLAERLAKQSLPLGLSQDFTPIPPEDLLKQFGGTKEPFVFNITVEIDGTEVAKSLQTQLQNSTTT